MKMGSIGLLPAHYCLSVSGRKWTLNFKNRNAEKKWNVQLTAGAAANLGTIGSGMTLGFSAVALPAMQTSYHEPAVSDEEASWVASLTSIGMPVGCLFMGPLMDRLGRKRTLMLVNLPAVLGWLLLASASHSPSWFLWQVYAGRLLTGLTTGLVNTPAVVYASETMEKMWRGVVVTWPSIGVSLGVLIVYVLGAIFRDNWRLVAGISTIIPVVSIVVVWYVLPETPVWLVSRGKNEEAELSIRRIRSVPPEQSLPDNLQEELDAMISSRTQQTSESSWKDTLAFLKRPEAYKPLLIFNAFFFFQQFSGIFVIIFYAVSIIRESRVNFDGYLATVLIGVCRLVVSVIISFASRRYGRRLLCNISGVGLTLTTGCLALFLSLNHGGIIDAKALATYTWIPVSALLLSVLLGTVGFLTLPFAMIGEVYPLKIRGSACGFTTFMATIFVFVAVKLYPEMKHLMGLHNVFVFYTAVACAGTVTMYFCLPETQGKTLEEIEEYFRSGGKSAMDKEKAASSKLLQVTVQEKSSLEEER
ncbi:facilitated trehalose transporter Tret1-like isoform X5 [Periplaneta americana]|uniref:facilitated trehalose transporter Tret1-like isoform X5 n=1 Tax=Periplaneta americana TaxID=6978 RepID=UPI0037E8915E